MTIGFNYEMMQSTCRSFTAACTSEQFPTYSLSLLFCRQAGGAISRRNYSFLVKHDAQQSLPRDLWSKTFDDATKPLVVDLGCGAGRYVLLMAHRNVAVRNYLGVDVHKAVRAARCRAIDSVP